MDPVHPVKVQQYSWDKSSGSYLVKDVAAAATVTAEKTRSYDRFLKGPIPWEWIMLASRLPRKALIIG